MYRGWEVIKKKREKLSRVDSLGAVPVKNQAVSEKEDKEGNITLTLIRRQTILIKVVSKIFFIPEEKKIRLDEIGSWVWRKCDGRINVGEMIGEMSEEFRLSKKEAEISLRDFLRSLSTKRLIGFELRPR